MSQQAPPAPRTELPTPIEGKLALNSHHFKRFTNLWTQPQGKVRDWTMVGAVDGGGNEKQQATSRPPKPTAHSPPSRPHLCDGTLGHEQQWEEKNWRKGGKGRGRCGRGKGIKTSKTKEQELGDSPGQGLRLDQMWRTMGQEAREPEGKGGGRPHRRVRKVIVLQKPRTRAPLAPEVCGQGLTQGQCKSQRQPQGRPSWQITPPTTNNNVIAYDSGPMFHFIPTISC